MTKERASANATGLPKHDLTTCEGRIAQFCEWFDIDLPAIEFDVDQPNAVLLTDNLVEWTYLAGASFDWIFAGNLKSMVAVFRSREKQEQQFTAAFLTLDKTEQSYLLTALKSVAEGFTTAEEAMAVCKKACEDHLAASAMPA